MSAERITRLCLFSALGSLALALTGCAFSRGPVAASATTIAGGSTTGSSTAKTLGGRVYGGNQPIVGATVTLWGAGTAGSYGTGANFIAATSTDGTGSFSFNSGTGGASACTAVGQNLYITSVGGNPGGGTNQYAALMAALPAPCSTGTGPNTTAATYVVVNEVTTVASVTALQQFMSIAPGNSPAWTIGAPAVNATGLANAFTQVGNLVSISTGTSGPTTATNVVSTTTYTTTITPDFNKINALADILAACINTAGSATCTSLFTDTTPGTSAAPTDTIQAAYYLATNAGGLSLPAYSTAQGEPYYLCSTYIAGTPPFLPYSSCTSSSYPTDWTIDVNWKTSNGTSTVGTANAASVAIDGSGNIWTAALNTTSTGLGITEFNPAGQVQFTPATTAIVAGGWDYSSCSATTCSAAFPANLGGTHQGDALAIDTNGNAWASSYSGSAYADGSQPLGVVARVAPGTGATSAYLVGSQPAGVALDGSNNLYVGDDSSTTTNRYYWAELLASGTPAYGTFETGSGRTAGNGDYYIGGAVDETANQYVWPWSTACQATIPRLTNSPSAGTASVVGGTTALPALACYIATDANGNAWVSTATTTSGATALMYVNVLNDTTAGIASPTVTQYAMGTNGSPGTGTNPLGGGIFNPQGMAIDGTGDLWVVNANGTGSSATGGGISEFASSNGTSLAPLSPSGAGLWGFFSNTTIGAPTGAAIDGSGNVWFKTRNGSNLYYLVGVASPVVTPIAQMVKTSFIGVRPGALALATLSPALTFNTVASSGESLMATLTNTGTAPVQVGTISFNGANPGDFSKTGTTCASTLAIGANCTITVTFNSSTAGTFTAALNVATNAAGSPQSVNLTASAAANAGTIDLAAGTIPPSGAPIAFGTIVAGSTTSPQAVVLANTGSTTMNLGLGVSGAGANLFPETTNCGSTLAAGAQCFVSFTFGPKVAGSYSAGLSLTNDTGTTPNAVSLSGAATSATITLNNSNAGTWVINNGAITLGWNSSSGNLNSWVLDGYTDQLTDTTASSSTIGLYMDNTGSLDNASVPTGGTAAASTFACTIVGGTQVGTQTTPCTVASGSTPYVDWSVTVPDSANSGNTYTFVEHWVVFPNDPGVHTYVELVHSTSDAAASVGQIQWVFRDNLSTFTNTYSVNAGLGILGVQDIPQPPVADTSSTDPGRTVSNAVEDLHGFSNLPTGFTREFYTKYDYAGYEYLHQAHGVYGTASSGTTYGIWTVLPKTETFVGGPTKQDLFFTNNIDMIEAYSNHELNNMNLNTAANVAYNRLFGPYYIHVNTLGTSYNQTGTPLATQADMYADAISAEAALVPNYDNEAQLVAAGYVPSSARGSVSIQVTGLSGLPLPQYTAWAVLSDPNTNFQYSCNGMEYWADISSAGSATFTGVVPGTYRLSVYVLGQWGEYRQDGIAVTANSTTTVPAFTFQPENFSATNGETIFTIGTPDRSSREFLHGHTSGGNDDREFDAAWNYWQDFAANQGAVVYYATAVGSTPATNDPTKWNYVHWNLFNPGLYAGVFSSSDDTTDGYSAYPGQTYSGISGRGAESAIPTYVANLPGATGTNGASTPTPAWQVYFATPNDIANYGSGYVQLSVAAACGYSSYVVTLNPSAANVQRIWHYTNYSDCMVRSGLSGYTQWFVMEFPASALNQTPGGSNEITISMSSSGDGVEDDALRLELTNGTSNPTTTGWNDYTYIIGTGTPGTGTANSSGLYNNDAIPNP